MRKGFTLLEVLLVVVVLAILASMLFGLMHFVESSRIYAAEARVEALGMAASNQAVVKGFPPPTIAVVAQSISEPGWVTDQWGNAIQYTVNGKEFKLWSFGPDGVSGTADDIVYKRN
jgi:general secretion pathway protein G